MIITGRRNVRNLLEYRNESNPESTFLIWESRHITYGELNEKVNRLANGFLDLGIAKGTKVLIHLSNCPEFIYSFFALLKIGAIAVLSNINHLLEEVCYTTSHSESLFVITEKEYYDLFKKVQAQVPGLKKMIFANVEDSWPGGIALKSLLAQCPADLKETLVTSDDDASIIYTSGSSDKPKAVLYVQGNYIFAGEAFSKQVSLTPDDRVLCVIPLFHSNGMNHQLFPVVTTGASMALYRKFSSSRFGDQIRENNITLVTLPGALLRFILNTPEKPGDGKNSLRAIYSGANILSKDEFDRIRRRFNAPLITSYGLTESSIGPLKSPLYGKKKDGSIGLPAVGYEVRIVDENDEELPLGQTGEIVARGMGQYPIMKEYYRDPEATKRTLKNGWLHTGDLGYTDEEGYFYFVERKKEMIRVGGENVAAGEVQTILNQHPAVAESAVIGIKDPLGNEAIKAFLVLKEGTKATEEEMQEYCSSKMAKFKTPRSFEFLKELPRTGPGKIDKKALRKMEESR